MTWLYPYWKKTIVKEYFTDRILDSSECGHEINEIKNYAQH